MKVSSISRVFCAVFLAGTVFTGCATWALTGTYGENSNTFKRTTQPDVAYHEERPGATLFLENEYTGVSLGLFTGSAGLDGSGLSPESSEILGFTGGFFFRIPIKAGPFEFFPSLGLEYDVFLDNTISPDFYDPPLLKNPLSAVTHNSLWGKAGAGFDFFLFDSFFIRALGLYGLNFSTPFEKNFTAHSTDHSLSRRMGFTFHVGIGGALSSSGRNTRSVRAGLAQKKRERQERERQARVAAVRERWEREDAAILRNLTRAGDGAEVVYINMPVHKTLNAQTGDVWFKFEPLAEDHLAFEPTGDTDTYMELYNLSSGGALVASNEDNGGNRNARITQQTLTGATYLIRVRGKRDTANGTSATGSFQFKISKYTAPPPQTTTTPPPAQPTTQVRQATGEMHMEIEANTTYRDSFSTAVTAHIYSLEVPAGYRTVTFFTEGSLDTTVAALNVTGMAAVLAGQTVEQVQRLNGIIGSNDDGGTGLNCRLAVTVPQDRNIYFLVSTASSTRQKTGSYTFTAQASR
jgi:hypothetical protein